MFVNHYAVLGVDEDADLIQISAARKKLLTKYHPDRNPGDDSAKEQTVLINNAYYILSDSKRRLRFDKQLKKYRASRDDGGYAFEPGSASDEVDSATGDSTSTKQSEQFTDPRSDPFDVNPTQKSNRPVQSSFGALVGIVLGGLTAIPIGLYFAWLITGTDPFGIFGKPPGRTALKDVDGEREKENNDRLPRLQNDVGNDAQGSNPDSFDSNSSQSKGNDTATSQNDSDQQPKSKSNENDDGRAEADIADDADPLTGNEDDQDPNIENEPASENTTDSGNTTPVRLTVPDQDQVALAKQKIAEIYRDEYESANSLEGREKFEKLNELSKQIMELQSKAADPVESYAIFEVAIDIARQSCFAVEALDIVEQFENKFEVDGLSIRMQHFDYWINELPRAVRGREAREVSYINLAKLARPFVDPIVETKNWELAFDFSRLVRTLYVRGGDQESADKVIEAFPELEWKRDEEKRVNQYLAELSDNPAQPDKQLTVGCYFCFVMNDWQRGLLHLNQSSRTDLAECVTMDQESDVSTNKMATSEFVGDLWWELANDDALKKYRDAIYARAEHHYMKALVDATGITRAKLIERIRFVSPLPHITIVSARFGWNRKWVDATESIREILEREPPVFLNSARGLKVPDPMRKIRKVTKITYTIEGERKSITLKAGPNRRYNLREQLK